MPPERLTTGEEITLKRRAVRPMSEALILGDEALPGEGVQAIPVEAPGADEGGEGSGQRRRIVRSAGIIMVGQLLSSVLGMVRIEVINILFYGAASGAFIIALASHPAGERSADWRLGQRRADSDLRGLYRAGEARRAAAGLQHGGDAGTAADGARGGWRSSSWRPGWPRSISAIRRPSRAPADRQLHPHDGVWPVRSGTLRGRLGAALRAQDVVYPAFATFIQHVGVIAIGVIALFIAGTKLGVPVAAIFAHGRWRPQPR